jgi:hypothetical protein
MSEVAAHRMTPPQFYDWLKTSEGKFELVGGEPVMMAGATNRRDR